MTLAWHGMASRQAAAGLGARWLAAPIFLAAPGAVMMITCASECCMQQH
jgi:hypothetical protein